MGEYQITCINKPDRDSPHERITHIGNGQWRLTLDTAVGMIQSGRHAFFTLTPGTLLSGGPIVRAEVRVVSGLASSLLAGHPYLRTYRDGIASDNLLSLPECPSYCPVIDSFA
jgi:uncharacterized protein DUF3892